MRRWTFRILTVASLLLAVAAGSLWVRSHWMFDSLNVRRWNQYSLASYSGGVTFVRFSKVDTSPTIPQPVAYSPTWQASLQLTPGWSPRWGYPRIPWSHLGFNHQPRQPWMSSNFGYRYYLEAWTVPYWSIVALALLLPGLRLKSWLHHRKQNRRTARGQCPACGYDLRATPGRCPECGAGGGAMVKAG